MGRQESTRPTEADAGKARGRTPSDLTRRGLLALSALGIAATGQRAALGASPEGQLTWAVHISLAPTWFDPAETPGMITPFLVLYALHDAMVKPMPGNAAEPCLAEAWKMAPDGLSYEFTAARGRQVPQRRAGDRGGREVLLRALSRHLGGADEGAGGGGGDAGRAQRALRAEEAVAGFPDVLQLGHRRGLDRAEEIRREGRRGGLQEGADRRRTVQVRLLHARRRTGVRGLRRLLAQDAGREAAGLQGDPRGGDAAGGAEARRGRSSPTRSAASWPRSCARRRD